MNKMTGKDKLIARFNEFIKETYPDSPDWPDISKEEMIKFNELIEAIADYKYGKDCDDDSPIGFYLVYKRKYILPFLPVPQPHKSESYGFLEIANINLKRAQDFVDIAVQRIRAERRKKVEK